RKSKSQLRKQVYKDCVSPRRNRSPREPRRRGPRPHDTQVCVFVKGSDMSTSQLSCDRTVLTTAAMCVLVLAAFPWAAPPDGTPGPTFSKDVAPILYRNCTSCHRPREIAPMYLLP